MVMMIKMRFSVVIMETLFLIRDNIGDNSILVLFFQFKSGHEGVKLKQDMLVMGLR